MKLDSFAWITRAPFAFSSLFPVCFSLTKALRARLTCVRRGSLKWQPAPFELVCCLLWSRMYGVFDLDSWILISLIVCDEYTHLCMDAHTHTFLFLWFLLIISQAFKFPSKTTINVFSLFPPILPTGLQEWLSFCLAINGLCPDADAPHSLTL